MIFFMWLQNEYSIIHYSIGVPQSFFHNLDDKIGRSAILDAPPPFDQWSPGSSLDDVNVQNDFDGII